MHCKGNGQSKRLYDGYRHRLLSANEMAVKFEMRPLPCQSLIRTIPENWRELVNVEEPIAGVKNKATKEILDKESGKVGVPENHQEKMRRGRSHAAGGRTNWG